MKANGFHNPEGRDHWEPVGEGDWKPEKYTMVDNGFLEIIARQPLTGRERRVLDVLVRLAWGWHYESVWIARGLLTRMTGLDRNNVYRILKGLVRQKVVLKTRGKPFGPKLYGINLNFHEWNLSSRKTTNMAVNPEKEEEGSLDVVTGDPPMSAGLATNVYTMSLPATPKKEIYTKKIKKGPFSFGTEEDQKQRIQNQQLRKKFLLDQVATIQKTEEAKEEDGQEQQQF